MGNPFRNARGQNTSSLATAPVLKTARRRLIVSEDIAGEVLRARSMPTTVAQEKTPQAGGVKVWEKRPKGQGDVAVAASRFEGVLVAFG
jgi:hypothetical protein